MRRFVGREWNSEKVHNILIISESDVECESPNHVGAGFEILILPSKYKGTNIKYIENLILLAKVRNGEVIYV